MATAVVRLFLAENTKMIEIFVCLNVYLLRDDLVFVLTFTFFVLFRPRINHQLDIQLSDYSEDQPQRSEDTLEIKQTSRSPVCKPKP